MLDQKQKGHRLHSVNGKLAPLKKAPCIIIFSKFKARQNTHSSQIHK